MFFDECTSLEELKKLYRDLAQCLHPDKGGNTELMKRLNTEYEAKKEKLTKQQVIYDEDEEYLGMINDILQFAKIITSFDPSFVKSILESYSRKGRFTEPQKKSLRNIYMKWKVKHHLKENENE